MALAIAWTGFGDARVASSTSQSDTLVLPSSANSVLYLLMASLHSAAASSQVVTLTSETVDTVLAWDNSAANSTEVNFGAFAVRNPAAGTKTLTLTENITVRSFAWVGYLVTGVPAGGYVDDTDHVPGDVANGGNVVQNVSLDPTKANGLLLALFGWRGFNAGPFSISAGWTEDADVNAGASTTTDVSFQAVHRTAPTAGNYTGTCTSTVSARRGVVAVSVLAGSNRPGSEVFIL